MHRFAVLALITALAGCAASGAPPSQAVAPPPPLIPLEELARAPDIYAVAVSPSGDRLASIETVDGRGAINILDFATGAKRALYRDAERSLNNVAWSGDGRWLLFLQDAGGDEGYHLFRLDPRESSPQPVDLTPFQGTETAIIGLPRTAGGSAVVTNNRRDREFADAYRIELASGELTELVRNDRGFTDFYADDLGEIGAASAIQAEGSIALFAPSGNDWREVYRAPADERFSVAELTHDGGAWIKSNRGRSNERLVRLDLASGDTTSLDNEGCGRFDDEGFVTDAAGRPFALICNAEQPGFKALTEAARTRLDAVRALAGADAGMTIDSHSADLSTLLVYSDSGDVPGRYLLYREGRASEFAQLRPWLANRQFQPTRAVWIDARDDLPLLSYVTRPAGPAGPAPLVVALHGGPWSRELGTFEPTTQLLANRGYAVLQVNFRGSTGLGRQVFEGGVREFGGAMSDDVIDAVDWAVAEGIADPDRVCVIGGSYGGYATLVAMTRDADRFRCGVDYAGPADLVTLMEAFPPSWQPFLPRSWYRFVGDPRIPDERAAMAARSPVNHIDRLTSPLLIFQGVNDPRVTQAQSDSIVCALRAKGLAADYLLAGNEGHSFGNEETGLAVNRATEQFLAANLGGRVQATVDPAIESTLADLRAVGDAVDCP